MELTERANEREWRQPASSNTFRCPPTLSSNRHRLTGALRKYLPIVCVLQSLVIILCLAYLYFYSSSKQPEPQAGADLKEFHQHAALPGESTSFESDKGPLAPISAYQIFSDGLNSARIRKGLAAGCDQKIHDLAFSVVCNSSNTEACLTVEGDNQNKPHFLNKRHEETQAIEHAATLITTSKSGLRHKSEHVMLKRVICFPGQQKQQSFSTACQFRTTIKVYLSEAQQEIIGWGGALSDSTINNLLRLSTNGTKRLLDDYFGQQGLMINLVRITIGGSDFSSRFYTNDDLPQAEGGAKSDDLEMENFRLREEDILYKIPTIKYIQNEYGRPDREIKLFASMWSPPAWMKTNRHFNKGYLIGVDGSNSSSVIDEQGRVKQGKDERYFKALAQLKKKFLLAYQDESIKFWGLTVMNEPLFAVQPFLNFNTMIFPKEDYANYVSKHLGPTIKEDPRLNHIKLMAHDDNRRYLFSFTDPILSDPNVRRFVDGVSVHGYIDEDYHLMDAIRDKYNTNLSPFFVLPAELSSAHLPFMKKPLVGNWHRGIHYALDIIRSVQHSAAGWVDWNMVLDTKGGPGWLGGALDSPVIVDQGQDVYHKSPMFYVLGQFSRYVPPKSFKLKSETSNDKFDYHFETVSFRLPGGKELATVVLNNNPYPVEINIMLVADRTRPNYFAYKFVCAADSVSTLIYPASLAYDA